MKGARRHGRAGATWLFARIYLHLLVTTAAIILLVIVAVRLLLEPPHRHMQGAEHLVVEEILREYPLGSDGLEKKIRETRDSEGVSIGLYNLQGNLVGGLPVADQALMEQVNMGDLEPGRAMRVGDPPERGGPPPRTSVRLTGRGHEGMVAVLECARPEPPPVGRSLLVALVVILSAAAVSAAIFHRTLAQPLLRMTRAVMAFGAGDLSARCNLTDSDLMAPLGRSFDEMAARIKALLQGQRELLANVSHELRTPLARIRVAMDLAQQESSSGMGDETAMISQDIREIEVLLEDIVCVARLDLQASESGVLPLRLSRVDCNELLRFEVSRFRTERPARAFDAEVGDDLPTIEADGPLIARVIRNLLQNAHRYTPSKGRNRLLARRSNDGLEVEVTDEGIGIDAQDLERVFEPFFRTDRSRARHSGGTGMGLTLARRIVEAHGGSIGIRSERDLGTRVSFFVPSSPRKRGEDRKPG